MLPIKKILCPTDFSDPSYGALKTANELALHFSAELIVVHVVSPIPVIPPSAAPTEFAEFNIPSYQLEMEAMAEKTLDETVKERIPDNVASRCFVVQGDPTNEIVRLATDENVDMIVIATHGLTGWRRVIFGSVAGKILRLAPCPVLSLQIKPE
jgi:nucleotide-binding universal stress UspA family protein